MEEVITQEYRINISEYAKKIFEHPYKFEDDNLREMGFRLVVRRSDHRGVWEFSVYHYRAGTNVLITNGNFLKIIGLENKIEETKNTIEKTIGGVEELNRLILLTQ